MSIQKIEAHSPEAQSVDLNADNIAKLKAMFPELLTETTHGGKTTASLNVEVLKNLVGDATAKRGKPGSRYHRRHEAVWQQRAHEISKRHAAFSHQRPARRRQFEHPIKSGGVDRQSARIECRVAVAAARAVSEHARVALIHEG